MKCGDSKDQPQAVESQPAAAEPTPVEAAAGAAAADPTPEEAGPAAAAAAAEPTPTLVLGSSKLISNHYADYGL